MPRRRALGTATVAILQAIRTGHRFGLDIMEYTDLPSGTVYPTLTRMEQRGYVQGQWEARAEAKREGRPRRRYYSLTPEGTAALEAVLASLGVSLPAAGHPAAEGSP